MRVSSVIARAHDPLGARQSPCTAGATAATAGRQRVAVHPTDNPGGGKPQNARGLLALLAAAVFLGMTLWLSATSRVPVDGARLIRERQPDTSEGRQATAGIASTNLG
jgi:hypothetical protein